VSDPLRSFTVAVTGLNATDNPAPGVAVIRSLRAAPGFMGKLLGLAYDALDSGLYSTEIGLDAGLLIPYPSQGVEALGARLREIHQRRHIDVIIPTLDSELPAFIALEPELRELGIRMFLPTRDQFELRSKVRLAELGQKAGLDVPAQQVLSDVTEVHRLPPELPYPLVVKGVFYGATVVHGPDEAAAAFHAVVAKWGLPVIVQRFHAGQEYDVVAVGDGRGGMVGAVPMRKLLLSDKGKGWAGVAVKDPHLLDAARRFFAATSWRGPCELEILKTPEDRYLLIEVNPRFPAWCHLASGAGQNLPWAVARLALGEPVDPMTEFRAGTLFVRISLDLIASMDDFQALSTEGELARTRGDP
jgi:carbamoyl-phosphate synthase large subunit